MKNVIITNSIFIDFMNVMIKIHDFDILHPTIIFLLKARSILYHKLLFKYYIKLLIFYLHCFLRT